MMHGRKNIKMLQLVYSSIIHVSYHRRFVCQVLKHVLFGVETQYN